MNKFLLYGHGDCENHGCEAIVRGTVGILSREFPGAEYVLSKQGCAPGADGRLNLPVNKMLLQSRIGKFSPRFILSGLQYVFTRRRDRYYRYLYEQLHGYLRSETPVALSIGGDNYCYGQHNSLYYLDGVLREKGCRKILWGCSIEPSTLSDGRLVEDLDDFDLIVGREPITVDALRGTLKRAKVVLRPDPAFTLETVRRELPDAFRNMRLVGVNVSPKVSNYSGGEDITFVNYDKMLGYILDNTDYGVLLIPHVTLAKSNDLTPLRALYDKYKATGRVMLVSEFDDCRDLKGYIAQCDMFIGARTHSTIAAYSGCVPCVVVGYSVKADGIAAQLFGTTENYVVSSQKLQNSDTLTESFLWLDANREQIKARLEQIMPGYIEDAYAAAGDVRQLID